MVGGGFASAHHPKTTMIKLKISELSKFNGKNGKKAYIAYNGAIYDVTDSFLWKGGKHFVIHEAGKDLTEELKNAPHDEVMLSRLSKIGYILED